MKYIQPDWPAPSTIKAYTTTRHGFGGRHFKQGEMEGAQDSSELESLLQLPNEPIWLNQIHSAIAIEAKVENKQQKADASFTQEPNRICVVSTADCLPILLCDKDGTQVAAIHAGWRGLANGIIEATLAAFQQNPQQLLAWLGPAIGPTKFEVGKDVYDAFVLKHPESAQAFTPISSEKWLASLYELAKIRLKQHGVTQVYGGDFCTYTQEDLFFSYRRDKGKTGRMASLIWIASKD